MSEGADRNHLTEQAGVSELQQRARRARSLMDTEGSLARAAVILPLLLNGAAMIAFVSFALEDARTSSGMDALAIYVLFAGVVTSAVCVAFAYLSQFQFRAAGEAEHLELHYGFLGEERKVGEQAMRRRANTWWGQVWRAFAWAAWGISVLIFALGALLMAIARL